MSPPTLEALSHPPPVQLRMNCEKLIDPLTFLLVPTSGHDDSSWLTSVHDIPISLSRTLSPGLIGNCCVTSARNHCHCERS